MNSEPINSKPKIWNAFGNIECILIERFYNLYLESNFSVKYQLVNMGLLTVDLKYMKTFKTSDKHDKSYHKDVKRGKNHFRPRPKESEKYSEAMPVLKEGIIGLSW